MERGSGRMMGSSGKRGRAARRAFRNPRGGPAAAIGALLAFFALAASACSTTPDSPLGAGSAELQPAPGLEPEPEAEPEAEPDLAPDCTPTERRTLEALVGEQLRAFADEDLDAAYDLTGDAFRATFGAAEFADLIMRSYPELIRNDGHRVAGCRTRDGRAVLDAGIRNTGAELALRYLLVEQDDGWRIEGAQRLPDSALPPFAAA